MGRIFNFGAGPSMLPLPVLEQAQAELLDYKGSGMSVMEISHRSDLFEDINHEAQKDIKTLLHLDDNWSVMFMGGGGAFFHDPYQLPDARECRCLCRHGQFCP